jgi:hypothetical protein
MGSRLLVAKAGAELSVIASLVKTIASPPVVRGEPEELVPGDRQPSLPGDFADLAGQISVIVAVWGARDRLGWQR